MKAEGTPRTWAGWIRGRWPILVAALVLPPALEASSVAEPAGPAPIAQVSVAAGSVVWSPLIDSEGGFALTVSGPGGFWRRWTVDGGDPLTLFVHDAKAGTLADGAYVWELVALPAVSPSDPATRLQSEKPSGRSAPRHQVGG